jgi:O-antigen/teichoic acid export membrane protein
MLRNVFRIAVHVMMLPIFARLLGPAEIGLFTLAYPALTFVLLLTEAGLGDSLAREKSDDTRVWSSAFWGLMGAAAVLAACLYAASFVIGRIAHQQRLPEIMLFLCATIFMVAATVIPSARMLRSGNLLPGAICDLLSLIVGAVVGVYLAFSGYGVWAMVWQVLSGMFARVVFLNWVQPFVPRLEFDLTLLASHMGVGGAILSTRIIELAGRMIENSQVSRALGASALGGYGYANGIGRFFSDAASAPIWLNLYYVAINRPSDQVARHYVSSHRLFALMIFPGAALLALALPTLVPVVFGPEWNQSTYPIMIMVLSSPFVALGTYHGAVMFAQGQLRIMMYGTIALALARVLSVAVTMPFGLVGLALGLSVVNIAYYLFALLIVSPLLGATRRDVVTATLGPLVGAIAVGICFYFSMGFDPSLTWLTISGMLSFLVYPVLLFLLDRKQMLTDMESAMAILRNRGETATFS